MTFAAISSGGKDSTLAVFRALKEGMVLRYVISMIPTNPESYMFHFPNAGIARTHAELMGVPAIVKDTPGMKEEELRELEEAIESVRDSIGSVSVGAVESTYQRDRLQRICRKMGMEMFAPLWHNKPKALWEECLDNGFRIMIVGVGCEGLGKEWLGRVIDRKALRELERLSKKHKFHLGGEGGEFETTVLDCPMFSRSIKVLRGETKWDGASGMYLIKEIKLVKKK
jgi:ABC transporter with metal-binding/Fe-S-binding domain ATP-binding protein